MNADRTFNPWEIISNIKPEKWDTIPKSLIAQNAGDLALARSLWLRVNGLEISDCSSQKWINAVSEVESDGGVYLAALALSRWPERFIQWLSFNGGIALQTGFGRTWFDSVMSQAERMSDQNMPLAA